MASALEKMMAGKGTAAPQVEGTAQERPATMQEKMIMGMMKQVLPGLDFEALAKIGTDAQEFAAEVKAHLVELMAGQVLILKNQDGMLAMLAQLTDTQGTISTADLASTLGADPELAAKVNAHDGGNI